MADTSVAIVTAILLSSLRDTISVSRQESERDNYRVCSMSGEYRKYRKELRCSRADVLKGYCMSKIWKGSRDIFH